VCSGEAAYKRLASHTVRQKVLGKLVASNSKHVGEVLIVLEDMVGVALFIFVKTCNCAILSMLAVRS